MLPRTDGSGIATTGADGIATTGADGIATTGADSYTIGRADGITILKAQGIAVTGADTNPKSCGEIKWNFNKFLIDKNGDIAARFEPKVEPSSPELKSAIAAALA